MNPNRKKYFRIFVLAAFLFASSLAIQISLKQVLANNENSALVLDNNEAAQPEAPSGTSANNLNCRYGIAGFNTQMLSWLPTLQSGWHVTFGATTPYTGEGEHVGIVRVSQDRNGSQYLSTYTTIPALTEGGLGAIVDASPGKLWLIGNEPDVADVQDDTYPAMYARIYHDVYEFIKDRDPSAQVGIAGLSMATPGRLQYLDIVWDTFLTKYGYPMPVDVWAIHIYILSEYNPGIGPGDGKLALGTDPALAKNWPVSGIPYSQQCAQDNIYCRAEHDNVNIFIGQIVAMRQWMKDHGQREKPLILSEFGSLYPYVVEAGGCYLSDEFGNCFTPTRVGNYLFATMDWLESNSYPDLGYPADENRLVQQWLWFSFIVGEEESGASSNLLKPNYQTYAPGDVNALTAVGEDYLDQVSGFELSANLYTGQAGLVVVNSVAPANTADAEIYAEFYNNGSQSISDPFTVTFYQDQALTQVIDSVTVNPTLQGCARHIFSASVTWPDLSSGVHKFWVKLDTGNAIDEGNENDNVASGLVIVDPQDSFLPSVLR
ncbi:MAG: hypothetical protein H6656_14185 [Ardenticatenaceae bacterium]|nr:hypothetical protein [Anaerolineales bacterium]MCB9008497.1 hypothetical protein [Ardenticatenaceae bacterium]